MNGRRLLILSLAFNVMLAVSALLVVRGRTAPAPIPRRVRTAVAVNSPSPAVAAESPTTSASLPAVVFDWSRLAADDLKKYRDNLRAIGCPEQTVRDIILGEIERRFDERQRVVMAPLRNRFWDITARDGKGGFERTCQEVVGPLARERARLIEDLFGDQPEREDEESEPQRRQRQLARYSWLPEDKQRAMADFDEQQLKLNRALNSEVRLDEDNDEAPNSRRAALAKQLDEERKQLLSPEELQELRLRESNESHWASVLPMFQPTEDEWRAVTRLKMQYQEATPSTTTKISGVSEFVFTNPDADADLSVKMHEALNQAIQETLGPERFAQYERAQDADFQRTREIAQRYALSDEVAVQAYDIQQIAQANARQVLNNSELTPEVRATTLAAIRAETEKTLTRALGPKVMGTYLEYGGSWLKRLNTAER